MNDVSETPVPIVTWLLCTNKVDNYLWRAIDSCLFQTFDNFELLIITNGLESTNIAKQIREHYLSDNRIRVVATDIQLLNFNLSLGVWKARGKYIARMDADDISKPNRLAAQVSFMDNNPDVIVLGSSYELVDDFKKIHGSVSLPCTDSEIRKMLITRNPFCHPSVMLRRKAIADAGAYLGGRNAEDYDLWCRLSLLYEEVEIFSNLSESYLLYNSCDSGPARLSVDAYSNVAACQFRTFLITKNYRWFFGSLLTCIKIIFRAARK